MARDEHAICVNEVGVKSDNSPATARDTLTDVLPPHRSYDGYHRYDPSLVWTEKEERDVVRRTDVCLLLWLCVMFMGLSLDRSNFANAMTDNLLNDLKLTTNDYNNGGTIQIVCYLFADFPTQLLTKRFGFRRVLPLLMIAWSVAALSQAGMHGRASFYAARGLKGIFEAGFIPSSIFCASQFYKSKEFSLRLSIFFASMNCARVLSCLLAAGILRMRGVCGWAGWRWLFLLEGTFTLLIGVISWFYLPSSPTGTKRGLWQRPWYNERQEAIMRILRDDPAKGLGPSKEPIKLPDIINTWKDSSMWGFYMIGLFGFIAQKPVGHYLALTVKSFGFSTFHTNLLIIPGPLLQVILEIILGWSSDKHQERSFHALIGEVWSLPLLVALLEMPSRGKKWSRYTLNTMIAGYPCFQPIMSAWISENAFDVKKRAIAIATCHTMTLVGALIASQIYRDEDKPNYHRGSKALLSVCAFTLLIIGFQRYYLWYLNRRKQRLWDTMTVEERTKYQTAKATENDGNKRLDFKYKY